MNRGINKQQKQGQEILERHKRYDLSCGELDAFLEKYKEAKTDAGEFDAVFRTILGAYRMGVAVGSRCGK